MFHLLTASKVVWNEEDNVRWTSLKNKVLQVLLAARSRKEESQDEDQEQYQVQPHPVNTR